MAEQVEPGEHPADNIEPGTGSEASRRSPELSVAPKPEAPAPKPKVEVHTRKLPTAFYVGAGVATVGVVLMLWAAWRREP